MSAPRPLSTLPFAGAPRTLPVPLCSQAGQFTFVRGCKELLRHSVLSKWTLGRAKPLHGHLEAWAVWLSAQNVQFGVR